MIVTIDHYEITSALKQFNIKPEDYYLLFDSDLSVVFIVWCTSGTNALRLAETESCIDIDPCNNQGWMSFEKLPIGYKPEPLVCVRYILATI